MPCVPERTDILVVGAGLSGLSLARHAGSCCLVIERERGPGGLATTTWERGYGFDRTGHLLHLRDASIRRWVTGLLGPELLRLDRMSRIWSHGVYTRYPFQANTFGLPPAVAYECVMGFLEARRGAGRHRPRSFEEFIHRHFGSGFARHFMIPYNTKIWGVHPREMTPAWCDRFVPVPRLEDVIAGAVGLGGEGLGYNARFLYPRKGIGVLAERIARQVEARATVRYGLGLRSVETRRRLATLSDGSRVRYEALVSTMPLDRLVALVVDAPSWLREAGRRLRARPLRYLDVALRVPAGTPYHWAYVPDPAVPFYRVGAYSNFSHDLVPPGCGSLYVELASPRPFATGAVRARVVPHLVAMGIIRRPRDIAFVRQRLIPHAYVVYDHAWQRSRDRILGHLVGRSVHSIGRYGNWDYSAMEDALIAGRETARILEGTSGEERR
jgi:protoporphyrinogen oxidase